jgi:N-acetylmuramoyl-L-alanine amidase
MFRTASLCWVAAALIMVLVHPTPADAQEKLEVLGKIVVDPGHGGENKGALGYNGTYEKDIVLQIALRIKTLLEERTTAEVTLTREADETVPLARRINMANELAADLFISLHCNSSFSQRPAGIETYVLSDKALAEESEKLSRQVVHPRGLYASASDSAAAAVVKEMLQYSAHRDARGFADIVQGAIVKRTKAPSRGVKELPIVILRGAEMPGVVIELGFISNPVEARKLTKSLYQDQIARGIVAAIVAYDAKLDRKRSPSKPGGRAATVGAR